MTASTNALTFFKQKSPSDKVLLCCYVVEDGLGDFYHLLDLEKSLSKDMARDILVETSHAADKIAHFEKILNSRGFHVIKTTYKIYEKNFQPTNQQTAYIFEIQEIQEPASSALITKVENQYSCAIGISVDPFIFEKFTIPKISIVEHYGHIGTPTRIEMNLYSGTQSLFLQNENRENPVLQLEDLLKKPENNELIPLLLNEDQKQSNLQEQCELFLNETLFVPCYFQHQQEAFIDFLNITQESPLSAKFKSSLFFANKIEVNLLEKALSLGMITNKVSDIIVKTKDKTRLFSNSKADAKSKPITFIVGYRILDDHDYNVLFHCSQYFAICSGDKTFEKALSNCLIPLYIPHNGNKRIFIRDAEKVDKLFSSIVYDYHLGFLIDTLEAKSINSIYNWHRQSGLEPQLPPSSIVSYAAKTQKDKETSFEYQGITYELPKDEQVIVKKFKHDELPEMIKLYHKSIIKRANQFNLEYMTAWIALCQNLIKNFNLHQRLEQILKKTLSDVRENNHHRPSELKH